ncbi:pentatricopeptide repeat-containing protein At5g08510 [Musa acuminata AAA Group]|uniref:pentatricopeptide repeat-containing protein At5g08510 n=1 Tax=Musa acuminata AAA Group TaxID=214697 RepID=UPI0031D8B42E
MNQIKQIHAFTLRNGLDDIQALVLKLLQVPNLPYAHALLLSHPHPPPTFLYNKLFQAYARGAGSAFEPCAALFARMRRPPNPHSFVFLFSACTAFARPAHGRALHARFLLSGLPFDAFVATSLLDFYAKSGLLDSARRLFDELPFRDVAMWNSLIGGYTRWGELDQARELFEMMPFRNVISWTTMVSGYAQNGRYEEAVRAFSRMWEEAEVKPNEVTLASVLPACAHLGAIGLGEKIENYAREKGLIGNVFVCNALLEMYGKCGNIHRARKVFDEMGVRRNLCSWNSMIVALAVHGMWCQGLELFHEMREKGILPNDITLVGVLLACTHGGLVDEGQYIFNSMEKDFFITPKLEHYGCMVDLLGRAGLTKEAYSLITSMPMEPDSVIWGALLGACSFHGDVQLAEVAAEFLFKLEPWNPGNLVILSNIYASSGRWNSVAKIWKMMKGKLHRKSAGYSIIELDGYMHKFLVEDKSHSQFEEIYALLDEITMRMRLLSYKPNLNLQIEC